MFTTRQIFFEYATEFICSTIAYGWKKCIWNFKSLFKTRVCKSKYTELFNMTLRACLRKNHTNMEKSCGSKFKERTEFYLIFEGYILRVRYITFVFVQDVSIYSNGRYCNLVMMPLKYRKFKEKLSISVNYYKFVNNI